MIKKVRHIIVLFIPAILATAGFAQQRDVFYGSLTDLMRSTYKSHPKIVSLKAKQEKNRLEINAQNADLKLQVDFRGWYDYYWADLPTYIFPAKEGQILSEGSNSGPYPVGLGLRNNLYTGLYVRQTVLDHRIFHSKKGMKALLTIERIEMINAMEEVLYKIANTYFEWQQLENKYKGLQTSFKNLESAEKIIKKRIDNSLAEQSELEELQLTINMLSIENDRLVQAIELKLDQLKLNCGLDESTQLTLNSEFSKSRFIDANTLVRESSNLKDSLLNAYNKSLLVKGETDRAKYLPSIDFYATFLAQSQSETINMFTDAYWNNVSLVGLELSIPIITGGAKNSTTQKIKLESEIVDQQKEMANQGFKLQIKGLLNELDYLHKKLDQNEKSQAFHEHQLKLTQKKFELGLVNIRSLIEAETSVNNSINTITDTSIELKLAELNLLKTTGQVHNYFLGDESNF